MSKIIAVDFDNTCVVNKYPDVGKDVPYCINILTKIQNKGHKIILLTMRADKSLIPAIEWFKKNNIKLFGINNNPTQYSWSKSRKVFANYYIDDLNVGCPLMKYEGENVVNWKEIEKILRGII